LFNTNGTTASLSITGGGAPVVGTWYHVAAVYDGTKAYLYVDGVEAVSGAPTGYVPNPDSQLTLGTRSENGTPWAGMIDEVILYDRGLAAEEISALYSIATLGPGVAPIVNKQSKPQQWPARSGAARSITLRIMIRTSLRMC
jgi:hypothetical protein